MDKPQNLQKWKLGFWWWKLSNETSFFFLFRANELFKIQHIQPGCSEINSNYQAWPGAWPFFLSAEFWLRDWHTNSFPIRFWGLAVFIRFLLSFRDRDASSSGSDFFTNILGQTLPASWKDHKKNGALFMRHDHIHILTCWTIRSNWEDYIIHCTGFIFWEGSQITLDSSENNSCLQAKPGYNLINKNLIQS